MNFVWLCANKGTNLLTLRMFSRVSLTKKGIQSFEKVQKGKMKSWMLFLGGFGLLRMKSVPVKHKRRGKFVENYKFFSPENVWIFIEFFFQFSLFLSHKKMKIYPRWFFPSHWPLIPTKIRPVHPRNCWSLFYCEIFKHLKKRNTNWIMDGRFDACAVKSKAFGSWQMLRWVEICRVIWLVL